MNKNTQELLKLIIDNPELPVVPMVDYEVVPEDGGRWMGSIGCCYVGEYAIFNERFYDDDREGFMEDYYDRNAEDICKMFGYHPEWEFKNYMGKLTPEDIEQNKIASVNIDKYLKEKADEYFKKAIIVNIDTPNEI